MSITPIHHSPSNSLPLADQLLKTGVSSADLEEYQEDLDEINPLAGKRAPRP